MQHLGRKTICSSLPNRLSGVIACAVAVGAAGLAGEALASADLFTYAPSRVEATITAFVDPTCPYSRKLFQQNKEMLAAGLKVKYVLWPRMETTVAASSAILCSSDRKKAFETAISGGTVPPATCSFADQYLDQVKRVEVSGTPMIVFQDRIIAGFMPVDELVARLGLPPKEATAASPTSIVGYWCYQDDWPIHIEEGPDGSLSYTQMQYDTGIHETRPILPSGPGVWTSTTRFRERGGSWYLGTDYYSLAATDRLRRLHEWTYSNRPSEVRRSEREHVRCSADEYKAGNLKFERSILRNLGSTQKLRELEAEEREWERRRAELQRQQNRDIAAGVVGAVIGSPAPAPQGRATPATAASAGRSGSSGAASSATTIPTGSAPASASAGPGTSRTNTISDELREGRPEPGSDRGMPNCVTIRDEGNSITDFAINACGKKAMVRWTDGKDCRNGCSVTVAAYGKESVGKVSGVGIIMACEYPHVPRQNPDGISYKCGF